MAFAMVSHAFRMLFSNFGDALKVSLVPFLILLAITTWVQVSIFGGLNTSLIEDTPPAELGANFALLQIISAVASLVLSSWIAVGWHRFVLVEEYPSGYMPPFRSSEVFLYIWKLILIALATVLMILPIVLVSQFLALAGGAGPNPMVAAVIGALSVMVAIFAMLVVVRWSVVLPAASIGKSMSLSQAWSYTKPLGFAPLWAFILVSLFAFVLFLVALITAFVPLVFLVVSAGVNLIATLLGVSVATTIYGVAVEGRQLT
ncbi:MAG: hypothetical protein AAGG79_06160 [Pseudomonadota bacterium]